MSLQRIALSLALLSACGAQISDGASANISGGDDDSGVGDPGTGGGTGSNLPPVDAAPTCAARSLYLNFEGQALTRALVSDATKNQASWMTNDTATAPAYRAGDGNRDNEKQVIVDGVRTLLAGFPVTVVTDRPATGNYVMVVLGGRANNVSSMFSAAVNTLDCSDLIPNDVAWIADNVTPPQHVINLVVGAVGFGLGLTATSDPNDCMCGWANNCDSNNNTACTLGTAIDRDPAAAQLCNGAGATQNEVTALHDAFCGK